MGNLIDKFVSMFKKPDTSDQERIERWKNEVDEADRIKELHRKARQQDKKSKKGLTVEDFERSRLSKKETRLSKKQKNKTLSSNF